MSSSFDLCHLCMDNNGLSEHGELVQLTKRILDERPELRGGVTIGK